MTDTYASSPAASSPAPSPDAGPSAKDAANDAKDAAKDAKNAAQDVVEQTKKQAGDLVGKTREQLTGQVEVQQASAVDTLRSLGDQLAAMTDHPDQDGTAVEFAAKARDRARSAADWLDQRSPDEVLDELRNLGRQRPGAFLLGAAVAGVVAGRLTRGVVAVHTSDDATESTPEPVAARHSVPTDLGYNARTTP